jgi:hypothetical protein
MTLKRVKKIKKSLKDKFDESWCVFDKDNTRMIKQSDFDR